MCTLMNNNRTMFTKLLELSAFRKLAEEVSDIGNILYHFGFTYFLYKYSTKDPLDPVFTNVKLN